MPLTIRVDHYFHQIPPDHAGDPATVAILAAIANMESNMAQWKDDVLREIAEAKSVQESTVTLIGGVVTVLADVKARLEDAVSNNDMAAVQAATADLDASSNALQNAAGALGDAVANIPPPAPPAA